MLYAMVTARAQPGAVREATRKNFISFISTGRTEAEAEDYKANITTKFSNIIDEMRYMEPHDYNKIVNTFKKYAVAGKNRGITGERTYGYDISRVDRKMIRRRRPN